MTRTKESFVYTTINEGQSGGSLPVFPNVVGAKPTKSGFTSISEEQSTRLRVVSPIAIEAKPFRGFTLMELLVVLAIIGLLAAIIFAALNVSRIKTYDSRVKAQLSEVRKSAEVFFNNNNGSYMSSVMATPASQCTGSFFTDTQSGMNELTGKATAWPNGTTLSCQATNSTYAITVSLNAANSALMPLSTNYWCVDSRGASKGVYDHILSGVTVCP